MLFALHPDVLENAVRLLCEAKARVNNKFSDGFTPLHHAAHKGSPSAIKSLIEAGARLRQDNERHTPLHLAAYEATSRRTDQSALQTMKALMAAPNATEHLNTAGDCGTPLDFAARSGFIETAKFLIEAKANVNGVPNACGSTPIAQALAYGHLHVAKMLLAAGACTHPTLQVFPLWIVERCEKTLADVGLAATPLQVLSASFELRSLEDVAQELHKGPLSEPLLKWVRSVATPEVASCSKCRMDSSPAVVAALQLLFQEEEDDRDNRPQCSNPKCSGALSYTVSNPGLPNSRESASKTVPPLLKKCARCLKVAYCSPACQKQHWRDGHKKECKPPSEDTVSITN